MTERDTTHEPDESESVTTALERALELSESSRVRYHIRKAMQARDLEESAAVDMPYSGGDQR